MRVGGGWGRQPIRFADSSTASSANVVQRAPARNHDTNIDICIRHHHRVGSGQLSECILDSFPGPSLWLRRLCFVSGYLRAHATPGAHTTNMKSGPLPALKKYSKDVHCRSTAKTYIAMPPVRLRGSFACAPGHSGRAPRRLGRQSRPLRQGPSPRACPSCRDGRCATCSTGPHAVVRGPELTATATLPPREGHQLLAKPTLRATERYPTTPCSLHPKAIS
jgi:hypothetical protein